MKKSDLNKEVLENFLLWYTHKNRGEATNEEGLKPLYQLTAADLYRAIDSYIKEDHIDGKENFEDHIPTFGAESSFKTEDTAHDFPEEVVVVADFGEGVGTQTVTTIKDINNLEAVIELLEFMEHPYGKIN